MKDSKRGVLTPADRARHSYQAAIGLRTTGTRRNILRQSMGRERGIVPSARFWTRRLVYESRLERRFLRLAVLSRSVVDVESQPETCLISESDLCGARDFRYTPDAAVRIQLPNTDLDIVFVECKPKRFADDPDMAQRLDRAATVLARCGIGFVVLTEEQLPVHMDATFDRVLRFATLPLGADRRYEVMHAMGGADQKPLRLLIERAGEPAVMHAIARGWLHIDLHALLTDDTMVHAIAKEGSDAARLL